MLNWLDIAITRLGSKAVFHFEQGDQNLFLWAVICPWEETLSPCPYA